MLRKNSGIEKFQAKEGGSFTVLSKFFLPHRTKKFSTGNHSVLQKISDRKKYFMDKRGGGGVSRFSVEFLLTVPKYFIGEHFGVSEKFFYRKFSFIGGGRGITVSSKFFVSQDRNEKLCKGTLLFFRKFSGNEKNLWIRGGLSRFSVEIFMSHSAEKFSRGTLQCVTNFGYRKILCFRELCHDFVSNFFCLTVPKNFIGETFCACVSEKFW